MSKKNLFLGGILIALVILAFIKEGPFKDWQEEANKPKNILAEIQVDQISRIDINFKEEETSLEKVGDKWRVVGTKDFYLKQAQVDSIQKALKDSAEAELEIVSTNKNKKDEFSASPESGAQIKLMQGETVIKEFIIGKTGSDFNSTYITMSDIDETYLVKAGFNVAFWHNDWYDREIFNSESEKINKIRFQYPTREFSVEKEEDGWGGTMPYIFSVDEEKLEAVIEIMSSLSAVEIPEQTFAGTGLDKNLIIIQANGEGVDNILMVGETRASESKEEDETDSLYYAKKGSSDNVYLITKEQRDELDKSIRDLR
ncbi:MAG: DUF4340 domain-containing protein [Patescibacteria group bacterium]|nr:DUF4340 domain-containing protein [Patescibacteria group bacterium]